MEWPAVAVCGTASGRPRDHRRSWWSAARTAPRQRRRRRRTRRHDHRGVAVRRRRNHRRRGRGGRDQHGLTEGRGLGHDHRGDVGLRRRYKSLTPSGCAAAGATASTENAAATYWYRNASSRSIGTESSWISSNAGATRGDAAAFDNARRCRRFRIPEVRSRKRAQFAVLRANQRVRDFQHPGRVRYAAVDGAGEKQSLASRIANILTPQTPECPTASSPCGELNMKTPCPTAV